MIGAFDMVLNSIEKDIKIKCIKTEKTQAQIAEEAGTTRQYLSRILRKDSVVNNVFVQVVEALGCDIELVYKKREE